MPDDVDEAESVPIRDAAVRYAGLGLSVLPCCNYQHVGSGLLHARSCTSPGKRPYIPTKPEAARGEWKEFQDRRATAEEVAGWYERDPRLNVGCALGSVSALVGIDIDALDGEELLAVLSQGELPETWEFRTGKDCGRRLLYRLPDGARVPTQSFKRPGSGAEILKIMSDGSQTVMPPSAHPSGAVYAWVPGRAPEDIPVAVAPAWLLAGAPDAAEPFTPGADDSPIEEGGRNQYMTRLAGAIRRVGGDEEAIYAALASMNERRLSPALEDREVRSVARSVARYKPEATVTFGVPITAENGVAGALWRFKWAHELAEHDAETEWVWEGFIPAGGITLLSALWKAGKTTLLTQLLKALGPGGEFLGLGVKPVKVLYVTEEMEKHWSRRRVQVPLADHIGFHIQPFAAKPDVETWLAFIQQIVLDVKNEGFGLVVFDTLSEMWPVKKENDAGEVQTALAPLRQITKAGAALLLVHHLTKAGGGNFTGSRGSGVISSFPDIIMEMDHNKRPKRKADGDDEDAEVQDDDNKRRIRGKGRYDETPTKMVVHWTKEAGFEVEQLVRQGGDDKKPKVEPLVTGQHDTVVRRVLNALPDDPAQAITKYGIAEALKSSGGWVANDKQRAFMVSLATAQLAALSGEAKGESYYRTARGRAVAQGSETFPVLPTIGNTPGKVFQENSSSDNNEFFPNTFLSAHPIGGETGKVSDLRIVTDEGDEEAA
jgi:hypothetical protein